jgi:hypothetical protein
MMRILAVLLSIPLLFSISVPAWADDHRTAARLEKLMAFAEKVLGGDPARLSIKGLMEGRRYALLQSAPEAADNINRYIDHHLQPELMKYEPVIREHMLAGFAENFTDAEIEEFVGNPGISPETARRLEEKLPGLKARWVSELNTILTAATEAATQSFAAEQTQAPPPPKAL